jgi:hypothetical protein
MVAAVVLLVVVGWSASSAAADGWRVEPTPSPVGVTQSYLYGVSCPSTTVCVAVGNSNRGVLAERWSGTRWSIQATPTNADGANGVLTAVSCSSATACTAVGSGDSSQYAQYALAERWNGKQWSLEAVPAPVGATSSWLNSVSCPSQNVCVAVGGYVPPGDHYSPEGVLVERWNGTSWAIQRTPKVPDNPGLGSVSCSSSTSCMAVGSQSLAERWNGTRWSILSAPPGRSFTSVSCTALTHCMVVGGKSSLSSTFPAWAAEWYGNRWTVERLRTLEGLPAAVSCASPTACTTVTGGVGSIHRWNGKRWFGNKSLPLGPLAGVSCASATVCTAVGSYNTSPGVSHTLAMRWNGP